MPTDPTADMIDGGFRTPPRGTGTLLLRCATLRGIELFKAAFLDVAAGRGPIDLTSFPIVQLESVARLELRLAQNTPRKRVARIKPDAFVWTETSDEWRDHAKFLDSFFTGGGGHHYLTSAEHNDAIIEVSYGETIPLKPRPA